MAWLKWAHSGPWPNLSCFAAWWWWDRLGRRSHVGFDVECRMAYERRWAVNLAHAVSFFGFAALVVPSWNVSVCDGCLCQRAISLMFELSTEKGDCQIYRGCLKLQKPCVEFIVSEVIVWAPALPKHSDRNCLAARNVSIDFVWIVLFHYPEPRINALIIGRNGLNAVLFTIRSDLKFRKEVLCSTRWPSC